MSSECRLFLTEGGEHWQLFTFAQSKSDASIYVGSPIFSEIKWLAVGTQPADPLRILDSPGTGKLSLHGTGLTHVRAHDGAAGDGLRFNGNLLMGKRNLGVRHLLTTLISKPEHLPLSPAFNRKSDQSIHTKALLPHVFIFWAVPAIHKRSVEVSASFNAEDLESVPPESGWGAFTLGPHAVVWFAYRTKHMQRWPRHPHVCFHDGYTVPFLIGTSEGGCRLEIRSPHYALDGAALSIRV